MESFEILIIILSVVLTVLLISLIVAMYFLIKVLRSLQSITAKADHVASNIDDVSTFFRNTAGPVALGKLIANIYENVRKGGSKK